MIVVKRAKPLEDTPIRLECHSLTDEVYDIRS